MSGAQAAERRAHPRRTIPLSVQVRVDGSGEVISFVSRDIGAGGLFLETEFPLPVGTAVNLLVHVHSAKLQLQGDGSVVRSVPEPVEGPPGMAIRFDGDSLVGWQLLKQLLEA